MWGMLTSRFSLEILLAVSLLSPLCACVDKELECRLLWVEVDETNPAALPGNLVVLDGTVQYVVRGQLLFHPGEYIVGRFDPETEAFFLPNTHDDLEDDEIEVDPSSFEILSNPNGCEVKWKTLWGEVPKFVVRVAGTGAPGFVGRHFWPGEGKWFSGHVLLDRGPIWIPVTNETTYMETDTGRFDVLVSYSPGIEMTLADFEFDDLFSDSPDFVGMDEIHNDSPATVTVNVKHKKTIIETYTMRVAVTETSTYTSTVKILFWKKTSTTTVSTTHVEEFSTREETTVTVTNEVKVPPRSSVQACTQIQMSMDKEVQYRAKAYYTARGMLGDEVKALLERENILTTVTNGVAQKDIVGSLNVTMALNTEFVVVPFDARLGCTNAAMRSALVKQRKLLTASS